MVGQADVDDVDGRRWKVVATIIIHLTYLFTSSSLPTVSVREIRADVVLPDNLYAN